MAGSFSKLWIVMVYENEGADPLSVEYPSQRIAQSADSRRCRAANVSRLHQWAPSLVRNWRSGQDYTPAKTLPAITPFELLDVSRAIQKSELLDRGPSSDLPTIRSLPAN